MARDSDDVKARRAAHEARERGESPYGNVPGAAPLAKQESSAPAAAKGAGRGLLRWLKRAVITLGALYLVGFVITITATVLPLRSNLQTPTRFAPISLPATSENVPALAYRLPVDPSITPDAAGVALARIELRNPVGSSGVKYRDVGEPAGIPWRTIPLPKDLFPVKRPSTYGLPRDPELLRLARGPLSADQKKALRLVGTAPVWKEFDLVARAGAIDMLGGRLELPLPARATFGFMPSFALGGTRDLADASLMRAAWHLSEGRRDSAEAALRAVISFGHAIASNTLISYEQNTGEFIRSIGADALASYLEVIGDPRGPALRAAMKAAAKPFNAGARVEPARTFDERRALLLERVTSPALPAPQRLLMLQYANLYTCGNAKEILFGPGKDITDAFAKFRSDVTRYPSEKAMLDLLRLDLPELRLGAGRYNPLVPALQSLGRLYLNERIGNCAVVAGTTLPRF